MTFRIKGAVDVDKFKQAFSLLVENTDVLRTVFVEVDGLPHQRVLAPSPGELEVVDLSTNQNKEEAYRKWLRERKTKVLPLDRPLYDSVLVVLGTEVIWYLNQHHLITDGHAFEILYRRLIKTYSQLMGQELVTGDYPHYADFVRHENQIRGTVDFDEAHNYWKTKVSGSTTPLKIYQRNCNNLSFRTKRISWKLTPENRDKLSTILQSPEFSSISQEMSLLAAFFTLTSAALHKISGNRLIPIGTPFHSRSTKDFKQTVGLFIEIGVVQAEVYPEDTFYTLYQKILQDSFDSMMNIKAGVSSAEINRSYSVFLNYFKAQFPPLDGMPVEIDWIHTGFGDQAHALRIQLTNFNEDDGYGLYFDLNESLFNQRLQEKFLEHFQKIFQAFLKDSHQKISSVDLRSPDDDRLWAGFVETGQSLPDSLVIDQFQAQVNKIPHQTALKQDGESITYEELSSRVNYLAYHLGERGVSSGSKVVFLLERSMDVVITILGILKTGATFIPIDSNNPPERVEYLIRDSQPAVLITRGDSVVDFSQSLDLNQLSWPVNDPGYQKPRIDGEDLAYILYTSGSTGQPKGVEVTHYGLSNYLAWAGQYYLQGQGLDFPLFTSLAFDFTLTSVFLPLLNGGKLIVYPQKKHNCGLEVLSVFQEDQVDVVKLTPSHLSLLLYQSPPVNRISKLILGGENLHTELAKKALEVFGSNIEIYNEYGPTEATIGCMIHRYNPKEDTYIAVPIGRPIDNISLRVLRSGIPVPAEISGEIFINGLGVARGYHNLPELTAKRFIQNHSPGEIWYATGDEAFLNEKGQLIYLGRKDRQTKINGARIELNEIKVQLEQHPSIQQAIVKIDSIENLKSEQIDFCNKCGLPSNYPEVKFDDQGICNFCREFDVFRDDVFNYFKSESELDEIVSRIKEQARGDYHCMMLLSGGKDSSFVLAKLVEKGLKVLAWTLDNGFISDQAKQNMRRLTDHLGVDLEFATTPHMNAIFADSLKTHSNVCHGCYKTIYTLSIKEAIAKNIEYIFTGLSRGQLFETRLHELFRNRMLDVEEMDQAILEARKLYHRVKDAANQLLDNTIFLDDQIFNKIKFVDYFRYSSVELEEMYQYLDHKVPWIKPDDTGRSTNCLINEAGIFVHKTERGYHNYALPYSWDVRLGHKNRRQALEELDDEIRYPMVNNMLEEVGYQVKHPVWHSGNRLVAYYQTDSNFSSTKLREYCMDKLPDFMIPHFFIEIDEVPLTTNGKIDFSKLPAPEIRSNLSAEDRQYQAPQTEIEEKLTEFWGHSLGLTKIGITDDFYDLGGHSMPAVQIVAKINQHFQLDFPITRFFENPDIKSQSKIVEDLILSEIEAMSDEEVERLSNDRLE